MRRGGLRLGTVRLPFAGGESKRQSLSKSHYPGAPMLESLRKSPDKRTRALKIRRRPMVTRREMPAGAGGFERGIGLRSAVADQHDPDVRHRAVRHDSVDGRALGGPQASLGWVVGALLALADGLVWAELGASMPGSGGTYVYLREAFQYRSGRLMPFLFVWTAILFIPLIMSTGVIGIGAVPRLPDARHDHGPRATPSRLLVVALVALLYRRVTAIGRISMVLWMVHSSSLLS